MPYTLADYSKGAASPLTSGVVDIFRQASPVADALTWVPVTTLDVETVHTNALPSVFSRQIGQGYTESIGQVSIKKEVVKAYGGMIDFPKEYLKAAATYDHKALQTSMFMKAMGFQFNNDFINGSFALDPDALVGIRWRVMNDCPASQSINGLAIDVSPDSVTLAADQIKLIDFMHQLNSVAPGGAYDLFVMNSTLKLRIDASLRGSGMLTTGTDSFGRTFTQFGSTRLLDIGTTSPTSLVPNIILNTELADGSATVGGLCTSIYGVKLGNPEYLHGLVFTDMEATDIGLLNTGESERWIIDWVCGLRFIDPFSLGRIYGIVAA